jgi:hypothetical protein
MTASYTNTDRFNKSRRAFTFPVMIPSTCSTCYSSLPNLSSSRLIPEHYSSTCYSPLQNLSIWHTLNTTEWQTRFLACRQEKDCGICGRQSDKVTGLSYSYCCFPLSVSFYYSTIINSSITDAESSYKLTESLNCGCLRTGDLGKYMDLRQ